MTPKEALGLEPKKEKPKKEKPKKVAKKITITCYGKTQTIAEWSKELGIPKSTIWCRYYRGDTDAECLAPKKEPPRLEYKGESLTVPQCAKRIGVTPRALYERLNKGWSVEDCLAPKKVPGVTRVKHVGESSATHGSSERTKGDTAGHGWSGAIRLEYNGEILPVSEWAKRTGRSIESINARYRRGCTAEQCLSNDGTCLTYLEYQGERLTLPEWSKRTGVPSWLIHERMRLGMGAKECLEP
jgi:hypothetical protein